MTEFYLSWPIHPPHHAGVISQRFADNPKIYRPLGLPGHDGLDFVVKYGQFIFAPCPGEIYLSESQAERGYLHNLGNHVRIRYIDSEGQEWRIVLAHLSSVCVTAGEQIKRGQVVGLAGNTGNVHPRPTPANPKSGTHLHLGLCRVGKGENGWPFDLVNPLTWLR